MSCCIELHPFEPQLYSSTRMSKEMDRTLIFNVKGPTSSGSQNKVNFLRSKKVIVQTIHPKGPEVLPETTP